MSGYDTRQIIRSQWTNETDWCNEVLYKRYIQAARDAIRDLDADIRWAHHNTRLNYDDPKEIGWVQLLISVWSPIVKPTGGLTVRISPMIERRTFLIGSHRENEILMPYMDYEKNIYKTTTAKLHQALDTEFYKVDERLFAEKILPITPPKNKRDLQHLLKRRVITETTHHGQNPGAESVNRPPTAFLSYSWDDEAHKIWVRDLAKRLRGDGVDAKIDQWETVPGDQLPVFMERAIRENEFVLIVCTPKYKKRSDNREGGVGYEGDIMTAEVSANRNHRKFIPLLRRGHWGEAAPSWLGGKYYLNMSDNPYDEEVYEDLLKTLHDVRSTAPPIGAAPSRIRSISRQQSEETESPASIKKLSNPVQEIENLVLNKLYKIWFTEGRKIERSRLDVLKPDDPAIVERAIANLTRQKLIRWRTNDSVEITPNGIKYVEDAEIAPLELITRNKEVRSLLVSKLEADFALNGTNGMATQESIAAEFGLDAWIVLNTLQYLDEIGVVKYKYAGIWQITEIDGM